MRVRAALRRGRSGRARVPAGVGGLWGWVFRGARWLRWWWRSRSSLFGGRWCGVACPDHGDFAAPAASQVWGWTAARYL